MGIRRGLFPQKAARSALTTATCHVVMQAVKNSSDIDSDLRNRNLLYVRGLLVAKKPRTPYSAKSTRTTLPCCGQFSPSGQLGASWKDFAKVSALLRKPNH